MKTVKLFLLVFMLTGLVYSQSDYQTVQDFKSQLKELEKKVDKADSAGDLDAVSIEVNQLESDYENEEALLDESLYPDSFQSSIRKIRHAIRNKRRDFVKVEVLEIKVDELESELEKLNSKNSNLLSEIKEYQQIGGSPTEVNKLIMQLKTSLDKRDQLVRSLVDSVLSEFVNQPKSLSEAELQKVYAKIESDKLFYNVEKTIRDNIEFLKVTTLTPDGLAEVKEDQIQFYRLWRKLGPKIADAYSGKKDKTEDVDYIDGLFSQWQRQLNGEIWVNIKSAFSNNNIEVNSFNSSETFVESVTSYIDSQIVKFDKIGYDASYETFNKFNEDVWQDELRSIWLPILKDNQMITEEQNEMLVSKVDEWEAMYEVESTNLWYFAGAAIVLALLILAFVLGGKSKERRMKNGTDETL